MSHFPARRFPVLLLALAALAVLAGCQGFSSSSPGSQNTPQNQQTGDLTATPGSVSFGNVPVGTTQTLSDTVTNTGASGLTITAASVSTAAFSTSGLKLPLTLPAGQSATFSIVLTPQTAGSVAGTVTLTNGSSGSPLSIALSGAGTSGAIGATLAAIPVSLTFTDVQTGKSLTQSETIQNTGAANATISQVTASGPGFSVSDINTPLTLSPGQTASLTVTFAPQSTGNLTGNLAITSNASNPTLDVALNGSAIGASSGQLNVGPSTINAGNVTVGTSGSQSGILSAVGASVVVSSVDVGSSEFSISGLSFPVILSAGQSVNFTVTFTPRSSGAASTSASFVSNASNSSAATLTGTGVAAPVHTVSLSWNPDNSPDVTGYNVYRRAGSSGSYTRINASLIAATAYTDTSITDGTTYYYETTAVNSSGAESAPSTAVEAVIPPP
jgi:hypothetical protein